MAGEPLTACGEELRAVIEGAVAVCAARRTASRTPSLVQDRDREAVIDERSRTGEARESGAHDRHSKGATFRGCRDSKRVCGDVQAAGMLARRTRADGAKDGARRLERSIELTEAPQDTAERRGISAIERVAVIQIDESGESSRLIGRPLEEGLAPGHAHVVVQLAVHAQAALGRVPQCITREPARQSLPRGRTRSRVTAVSFERGASPRGERGHRLHVGCEGGERVG